LVWAVALPDEGQNTHAGPSVAAEKVIVPSRTGGRDVVYCFEAATGKELWRCQCPYEVPQQSREYGTGIRASPTIWKDCAFLLGCYGQLLCLDTGKGELLWSRNLLEEFKAEGPPFGMSAAPVMIDGLLICQPGGPGAALVALEPLTGKTVWQSGDDEASYAAPQLVTLCGVRQVLAFTAAGLLAVDPATGKELWRFAYREEREKNVSAPIALGDTVYFSNNTLGFSAVKLARAQGRWTASRLWSARQEKTHYCSPILGPGCLYFHNSKGVLKCLDLRDGSIRWAAPRMGALYGALLGIAAGRLLALLDDGQLLLLEVSPEKCTEKARCRALSKCFAQPAIANGKLYVRDHERLVCMDLKNPLSAPGIAAGQPKPEIRSREPEGRWETLRNTCFTCVLTALTLALLGVVAVKRKQVLACAAVTQSATLALMIAMWLDGILPAGSKLVFSANFAQRMAAGFATAAAFLAEVGRVPARARQQAAWLSDGRGAIPWFLFVAATAGVAFISQVPLGTIDLHHVLASTIVGDTRSTVADLEGLLAFMVFSLALLYALAFRPGAPRQALPGAAAPQLAGLLAGPAIGLSVRATGTFFTFAFLIFPALTAQSLFTCGGWCASFAAAAGLAVGAVALGLACAEPYHQPPAQLAAALVCLAYLSVLIIRRRRGDSLAPAAR
jgi:outer membrane protein assembly factor BamB/ABC-type Mn2+/Zn2+ transport system permease subunit